MFSWGVGRRHVISPFSGFSSVNYLVCQKCYLSSITEQIAFKQNVKVSNICLWLKPFKEH